MTGPIGTLTWQTLHTQLWIAGMAIVAVTGWLYWRSAWRGEFRPHSFTWKVFMTAGVAGTTSSLLADAPFSVVGPSAAFAVVSTAVFVTIRDRPSDEQPAAHWAWPVALVAIVVASTAGLLRGLELSDLMITILAIIGGVGATLADAVALWPTIKNVYLRIEAEPAGLWLMDGFASLLGVLAATSITVGELTYPVYLVFGNMVVGLLALARR